MRGVGGGCWVMCCLGGDVGGYDRVGYGKLWGGGLGNVELMLGVGVGWLGVGGIEGW